MNKVSKRIVIISFYLIFFLILGGVLYFLVIPEPTCFDGKQNQGELGVDCGGPCQPCPQKIKLQPLRVVNLEYVKNQGGNGDDIVLQISNPNEQYGLAEFNFVLKDDQGRQSRVYKEFILPKETKYVVIKDFVIADDAQSLSVRFGDQNKFKWRKIDHYDFFPKLVIHNEEYRLVDLERGEYAQVRGLITNKSAVDYETIKVKGILRDNQGKLIGAGYHILNTLAAAETREFIIHFSQRRYPAMANLEMEAETNIFQGENYVKPGK